MPGSNTLMKVDSVGEEWVEVTAEPTIPAYVPDLTPPDAPVIKTATTAATTQNDGSSLVSILVTVGYVAPPGPEDLDRMVVQATRFKRTDDLTLPDWTLASEWWATAPDELGSLDTDILIPNVLAASPFWLRACAVDHSGNRSSFSPVVALTSASDTQGPPVPSGVVAAAGHSTIGLRWDPINVLDLDYVEVQWRVAPVGNWTSVRVDGTMTIITGLTNGTSYDVRLRSVDTSGNVQRDTGADDAFGNPIYETVKVATDPNGGWVSAGTLAPGAIPGNALIWDEAMIAEVFAGSLNADWIVAGTLRVGGGADRAAAIEVYDSAGRLIGRWSTAGIEVLDPDNPGYRLVLDEASLVIYADANTETPFRAVALTPLGIDAASITFGSARGGHNLVQNSSFELGRFGAVATTFHEWTVAADWDATRVGSDVNITVGATALTMTTVA
jgi:hypothetical protein